MADHVALMREAAGRLRAGFELSPDAYPLLADLLDGAAHREEDYLGSLEHDGCMDAGHCVCGDPEPGDEAALATALATVYLRRTDGY
jgi:hypothetical protein